MRRAINAAGQTPSPGHLGAARAHPARPPRLRAQPFCLRGERAARGGGARTSPHAAGRGRYISSGPRPGLGNPQAVPRAGGGRVPSPAAPWRRPSAPRPEPATVRAAAARCPRPPTARRGAGARTPGTASRRRPAPLPPRPCRPRLPSSSSPPSAPPHPPPGPRLAAIGSACSGLTSPLRIFAPPRRSGGFWRPWVDAGGQQEEAGHRVAQAVSEGAWPAEPPRGAGGSPGLGTQGPRETRARPAPRLRSRLPVALRWPYRGPCRC